MFSKHRWLIIFSFHKHWKLSSLQYFFADTWDDKAAYFFFYNWAIFAYFFQLFVKINHVFLVLQTRFDDRNFCCCLRFLYLTFPSNTSFIEKYWILNIEYFFARFLFLPARQDNKKRTVYLTSHLFVTNRKLKWFNSETGMG